MNATSIGTLAVLLAAMCLPGGGEGIANARPITPHDLVSLSRITHPTVSKDGRWLVWEQQEMDLAANRARHHLWRLDLKQPKAAPEKVAWNSSADDSDPEFGSDGRLYFISDRDGGASAVWHVDTDGNPPERVTTGYGIDGFRLSPKCDQLLVWAARPLGARSLAQSPEPRAPNHGSARTYDHLPVRFWNQWSDGQRSQLFVIPLAHGHAMNAGHAIEGGLVGDAPSKLGAGRDELAWSADERTIYFTLREAGHIEPLSTNLDLFAAPSDGSGSPVDLTKANPAIDTQPAVSPDGKWLAWLATDRPGYENDRHILVVRELATGRTRAVTSGWDRSIDTLRWVPGSSALYVTAQDGPDHPLFRVAASTGHVERITAEGYVADVEVLPGGGAIYSLDSLTAPADFWRKEGASASRLTAVNAAKLAGVDWPAVSRFNFKGALGDDVHGLALFPTETAGKKVPVLLLVHGGPQNSLADRWTYSLNAAVLSGPGLGVVAIDFHGSTGYGQAFTDSVHEDWGGKPLIDLQQGLDAALRRYPQLDGSRACAAGGSYGGFMMNWIEGNWPDRFRCLVQADGPFDTRTMTYETDDLRADEWDFGDLPYHENPDDYEKWSPVHWVAKWRTPMLVLTGEQDFRTPASQAIAAFTALQERQVPSKLVVFPDEGHVTLKPKNSLQWYSEVLKWLREYTASNDATPSDACSIAGRGRIAPSARPRTS